jgi:FkbM family methyltransferase
MGIFSRFKQGEISKKVTSLVSSADSFNLPSCMQRIQNMKNIGFSPGSIFDCGASLGHWSWEVGKIFKGVQIVAIEPNSKILTKTKELLSCMTPPPIIESCAIGAENKTTFLNVWDNDETKMSGSSLKNHVQGNPREKLKVKLKTLDTIANEHSLQPNLVKLDLQGYELEALEGATELLETTEVFIIEFGCLEAYIDRTTPFELMEKMYNNNYCLYDIVDLIYRPYDNALTGGDFFFVKNESTLKKYKGYK